MRRRRLALAVLTGLACSTSPSGAGAHGAGDRCPGDALRPVAGTGACTHGRDPVPAGHAVDRDVAPLPAARGAAATPPAACVGDGVSGPRVQVLYVRASDVPDRYSTYASSIRQWAADADAYFRHSAGGAGGNLALRFVHDSACAITVGRVTLSPAGDDSFSDTVRELQGLGYRDPDRKYMLFVDAHVLCGVGGLYNDDRPGQENLNNTGEPSYGRTDAGCWGGRVAAHELMHNLGGVQLSAPHSSGGFHCVDEADVMCYSDQPNFPPMRLVCPYPGLQPLDCGNDDYFHPAPPAGSYLATHWNTARSRFLATTPAPPCPDAATEGDGGAATARTMAVFSDVSRAICTAGDQDWLRIALTGGRRYRFEAYDQRFRMDSVIELYGPNGTTRLAVDDNGGGAPDSLLRYTPATTGTYFLKVRHKDATRANVHNTYALRVGEACPDEASEPDGRAGQAKAVPVPSTVPRAMCAAGDLDWVKVSLAAGRTYTLETRDAVDMYAGVELYAPDRTTFLDADMGGSPSWSNARLHFTPTTSGTYHVKIRGQNGSGWSPGSTYRFRVARADFKAPTVTARAPGRSATGVAAGVNVTATFSELVEQVTGSTFHLTDTNRSTTVAATVTRNGTTNQWILDPVANLAPDTTYRAAMLGHPEFGIRDPALNALESQEWTFTTGPVPTVTHRSPGAGAAAVPAGANVLARFSEAVDGVNTSTFVVKDPSGARVGATVTRNGTTNQWILDPGANLRPGTRYTATLTGGTSAIRDLAGNPLKTLAWSFTTAS